MSVQPHRPGDDDRPIGHPVVALARAVGCTEGQVYTLVTAFVVALLLAFSAAHTPATDQSGTTAPASSAPAPAGR